MHLHLSVILFIGEVMSDPVHAGIQTTPASPEPDTPIPQSRQTPSPGTRGRHPQDQRQTPSYPGARHPLSPRADTLPRADSFPLTPEADTPRTRGRHPPEQTHSPEQTPPSLGSRHPPGADPPAQCVLGDTGNKQVVLILLECILVM